MVVFGTPLSDAFVEAFLQQKLAVHASLLSRIQSRSCNRHLLANDVRPDLDVFATRRTQLPLDFGGLGLRSPEATRVDCVAAHWASWGTDIPGLLQECCTRQGCNDRGRAASCLAWAPLCNLNLACARRVLMHRHGNSWLQTPARARWRCETLGTQCEDGRGPPRPAWTQRRVKACLLNLIWLRTRFCCLRLALAGRGPSQHSQPRRSFACRLNACEFFRCSGYGCHFRTLGDHRAACPVAGVLGPRGAPLERAAARVCREGGARVATNVFLHDMNIDLPLADSHRIKVLANGLPLWQGSQAAVDTTFVSPGVAGWIRASGRGSCSWQGRCGRRRA